jgi:release factor glutamine methyltransferase
LSAYRTLAPQLPELLDAGGLGAVEIGASQGDAVVDLLARDGLRASVAQDLAGRDRAVLLTCM